LWYQHYLLSRCGCKEEEDGGDGGEEVKKRREQGEKIKWNRTVKRENGKSTELKGKLEL
jgi:hypothetical protein